MVEIILKRKAKEKVKILGFYNFLALLLSVSFSCSGEEVQPLVDNDETKNVLQNQDSSLVNNANFIFYSDTSFSFVKSSIYFNIDTSQKDLQLVFDQKSPHFEVFIDTSVYLFFELKDSYIEDTTLSFQSNDSIVFQEEIINLGTSEALVNCVRYNDDSYSECLIKIEGFENLKIVLETENDGGRERALRFLSEFINLNVMNYE